MEQLIIKALKSSCGNRNLKFQVLIQDEQLHVYANHREDYDPNYLILEENVRSAIALLSLKGINQIWLYSRPLGQVEPNWQVLLELPTHAIENIADTTGSSDTLSQVDSEIEIEGLEDFEFPANDSLGDTGLLQSSGLVHGCPLIEEEINTLATRSEKLSTGAGVQDNNLAQYCFVINQKLLTDQTEPPQKNMMRMVKFLHHLDHSDQHQILPILEKYFREGITPGLDQTPPAIQKWVGEIKELNEPEQNLFFVWLSRYCFDPSATLEEFQTISAQQTAARVKKKSHPATEYSFTPANPHAQSSTTEADLDSKSSKFKLSPLIKQILLPGIWILTTVILILLGIITHHSQIVIASPQVPALCNNALGTPEYCRLAVNLAGEKTISQAPTSLFPLTEVTEIVADYGCGKYANLKAGIELAQIAPDNTPVISSQGQKIFPHIYVVQVQQKNSQQPGNTRVGCVYTAGKGQRSPKKLAADVIPENWPTEHYQQEVGANLSLGIYTNPVNLGIYTIFAALGIAIASTLNLGLKIQHSHTVYLVALLLGIVQLAITLVPFFGLWEAIIFPSLTLLAASWLFKDYRLPWKRGYPSVAINVLVVIASQFLLSSLCFSLITNFV